MELGNVVYAAIIGECERLEHEGAYRGNGHHLAQRLTQMVVDAVESQANEIKPVTNG